MLLSIIQNWNLIDEVNINVTRQEENLTLIQSKTLLTYGLVVGFEKYVMSIADSDVENTYIKKSQHTNNLRIKNATCVMIRFPFYKKSIL